MQQLDDLVVGAVALSGGNLVGRIRMQKVIYLLQQLGMGADVQFEYHHYGPYSEAVSDAVTDAKFWGKIEEVVKFRLADGAPYSTFKATVAAPDRLGKLDADNARQVLQRLSSCTSTVLELAATAHWLYSVEKIRDWKSEITSRKLGKTGNGNLDKAVALLKELNLGPS